MGILEELWSEEFQNFGISPEEATQISDKWLAIVRESYESRDTSDLSYLEFKLGQFKWCREKLQNRTAVFFAIVFQTIKYDIKSLEFVDECIQIFKEFVKESDNLQKMKDEVIGLIELSRLSSTEEHKTKGVYGESDQHYFLDINFAVFGSSWEDYSRFCEKNRREYDFLQEGYKTLRKKFLQSFVLIPNIFATKDFRDRYEEQARDNLKKEIENLK